MKKLAPIAALDVERLSVRLLLPDKENARTDFSIRATQNFTPPVPFRRISRSLSVTGGWPSPQRLTSN